MKFLPIICIPLLLTLTACGGGGTEQAPSSTSSSSVEGKSASATGLTTAAPGQVTTQGYWFGDKLWRQSHVPVCWLNPTPGDATQRAWVQQAIELTWQANANIHFVGWQACGPEDAGKAVQILIADTRSRSHLGTNTLAYAPSMTLNLTFSQWGADFCGARSRHKTCVEFNAVHEFGHALGFGHEQERPDTPATCLERDHADGLMPGTMVGPWDKDSVMNYCNINSYKRVSLSNGDIDMVQQAYGARSNGLRGAYFDNADLAGEPVFRGIYPVGFASFGDYRWNFGGSGGFSMRWSGFIDLPQRSIIDGSYSLSTLSEYAVRGVRVWLDDQLVIDEWADGLGERVNPYRVTPGRHSIRLEARSHPGESWSPRNFSLNYVKVGGLDRSRDWQPVPPDWLSPSSTAGLPCDMLSCR